MDGSGNLFGTQLSFFLLFVLAGFSLRWCSDLAFPSLSLALFFWIFGLFRDFEGLWGGLWLFFELETENFGYVVDFLELWFQIRVCLSNVGFTIKSKWGNDAPKYDPSTSAYFFLGLYRSLHLGQYIFTRAILLSSDNPIGIAFCF